MLLCPVSWLSWYWLIRYRCLHSSCLVPPLCQLVFVSCFSWICTLPQSDQLSIMRCTSCHMLANLLLGVFGLDVHFYVFVVAASTALRCSFTMSFSCWLACLFTLHGFIIFCKSILASLSSFYSRLLLFMPRIIWSVNSSSASPPKLQRLRGEHFNHLITVLNGIRPTIKFVSDIHPVIFLDTTISLEQVS